LGSKPNESATRALVGALSDEDGMVCSLAVRALTAIGGPAVPSLIETVQGGPQSARIQALRALAEIRDHRAIPVMMQVMDEDSALLQYWAKEGLERLGLDMVYLKPV
jgi:HEAT repeat protein